jgi:hypothetical protein
MGDKQDGLYFSATVSGMTFDAQNGSISPERCGSCATLGLPTSGSFRILLNPRDFVFIGARSLPLQYLAPLIRRSDWSCARELNVSSCVVSSRMIADADYLIDLVMLIMMS